MNYYSHHIGDFDRATRHLTRIERSIYLDLMFTYYDTEQPLSADVAALCRKIVARTEEEKAAVLAILDEFFIATPSGWFHDRCEEELARFREAKSQASAAGKASAAARAERRRIAINGSPTGVERRANETPTTVERPLNDRATEAQQKLNGTPTNQEPITNNQEPETKSQKKAEAKAPATGTRLPTDWRPSDADIEYCKTERPDLRPSLVATNFYDYWIAVPGSKGRKADWSATWRTWVRKESMATAGRTSAPPRGGGQDLDEQRRRNTEEAMRLLGIADHDEGMTINEQ